MLSKIFSNLFGVKSEETKGTEGRKVTGVTPETFNADFQRITAKKVAAENGIEYISKATGKKLHSGEKYVNQVYAVKGKYILLHPANDGMPTCPIEWFGKFDGKDKMIMDNQSSFKGITNLSDIILQMVRLYVKYIDDDDDEIEEYRIVGSKEADPSENKISNESPLAKAIMGAKALLSGLMMKCVRIILARQVWYLPMMPSETTR